MAAKTPAKKRNLLVVRIEQFFDIDNDTASEIETGIRETLETARNYAGARVVSTYTTEENAEFLNKAISELKIQAPIILEFD
jgi:hypothetical protein